MKPTLPALLLVFLSCSTPVGPVHDIHRGECLTCDFDQVLARCVDGFDNDEDQLTDCDDPDCQVHPACNIVLGDENIAALCADGVDNDDNGYIDCADFGCIPTTACRPEVPESEDNNQRCFDGLDNDHDGELDCRDFNCHVPGVTVCEGNDVTCGDGIDNDENGFTDCSDYSCSQNPNVTLCQ